MSELALDAADLGFLTSVYFLTFAAAQVPVGLWLDRYGPRRVQSALLLVAASGAALFSMAEGFTALVLARALIGLGVAASLTAGLKASVLWFPKDRIALVNGYMVMLGALGAVTATSPAEHLLGQTGWRGLFGILCAATALTAVAIWVVVPEAAPAEPVAKGRAPVTLKTIYADPRFWQLAPLSATCVGTAWALQGLWAAPWLTDVGGLDRAGVIRHLSVMAFALSAGALLLGTAADRLRRHGVGPQALLAFVAIVFIAAQLALVVRLPVPSYVLWSIVAAVGANTVVSYAILAEYFPREVAGRANGALNVFHFGGAFILQYAPGVVLAQWPSQDGHYPAIAYQTAFGLILCLQVAALAWFALPWVRKLGSILGSASRRPASARSCDVLESGTSCRQEATVWIDRLDSARVKNWRLAALGATGLSALLGLTLAISAGRASVTRSAAAATTLNELRAILPATEIKAPSEAEIAYVLARFVRNLRSLSVDPVADRPPQGRETV
jgi:MFS family permease